MHDDHERNDPVTTTCPAHTDNVLAMFSCSRISGTFTRTTTRDVAQRPVLQLPIYNHACVLSYANSEPVHGEGRLNRRGWERRVIVTRRTEREEDWDAGEAVGDWVLRFARGAYRCEHGRHQEGISYVSLFLKLSARRATSFLQDADICGHDGC